MKIILTVIVCIGIALLFFSACVTQKVVQKTPDLIRAFAFDVPAADEILLKKYLPKDIYIIPAYTYKGDPIFIIVSEDEYNKIKVMFKDLQPQNDLLPINRFWGLDFAVSNIEGLSFLTKEQLNSLTEDEQRNLSVALNPYKKATLFGESPKKVLGVRENDGKYYPDFSEWTYGIVNPAAKQPDSVLRQNKRVKKPVPSGQKALDFFSNH
jgi:hypothetical protein